MHARVIVTASLVVTAVIAGCHDNHPSDAAPSHDTQPPMPPSPAAPDVLQPIAVVDAAPPPPASDASAYDVPIVIPRDAGSGTTTTHHATRTSTPAAAPAATGGEPGSIMVVVVPWGNVQVDNGSPQESPTRIAVPPGRHTIHVSNPSLQTTRDVVVTVAPGQRMTQRIDLGLHRSP